MKTIYKHFAHRTLRACRDTPIAPLLIVAFALSVCFVPHFATAYNLKNYLLQSADQGFGGHV